jgi:hypothetical protein
MDTSSKDVEHHKEIAEVCTAPTCARTNGLSQLLAERKYAKLSIPHHGSPNDSIWLLFQIDYFLIWLTVLNSVVSSAHGAIPMEYYNPGKPHRSQFSATNFSVFL